MGALKRRHCCFLFIAVVFLITKVLCAVCRKLRKYRKAQKRKIKFIYHQREQWIIFWYMTLEWFIHTHLCTHPSAPPSPQIVLYNLIYSLNSKRNHHFLGGRAGSPGRQVEGAETFMAG